MYLRSGGPQKNLGEPRGGPQMILQTGGPLCQVPHEHKGQSATVADGFEMEINEPPIGFEIDRKECVATLI